MFERPADSPARAGRLRAAAIVAGLAGQFLSIAAGAFLGVRAEQWRDDRNHRVAAHATLHNLRDELARNRKRLADTQPYHLRLGNAFVALQQAPTPRTLDAMFKAVDWHGMHPLQFRHAAWDLALANQSLGDIDPQLAFDLSDVYEGQRGLIEYQQSTLQNALAPSALRDDAVKGLSMTLAAFLSDAGKYQEPDLLHAYDALIPRLDAAMRQMPQ